MSDRACDVKKSEHGGHRTGEMHRWQARTDHDAEQRHEQQQAQPFQHRAKLHQDRSADTFASGKSREVTQKIAQIGA